MTSSLSEQVQQYNSSWQHLCSAWQGAGLTLPAQAAACPFTLSSTSRPQRHATRNSPPCKQAITAADLLLLMPPEIAMRCLRDTPLWRAGSTEPAEQAPAQRGAGMEQKQQHQQLTKAELKAKRRREQEEAIRRKQQRREEAEARKRELEARQTDPVYLAQKKQKEKEKKQRYQEAKKRREQEQARQQSSGGGGGDGTTVGDGGGGEVWAASDEEGPTVTTGGGQQGQEQRQQHSSEPSPGSGTAGFPQVPIVLYPPSVVTDTAPGGRHATATGTPVEAAAGTPQVLPPTHGVGAPDSHHQPATGVAWCQPQGSHHPTEVDAVHHAPAVSAQLQHGRVSTTAAAARDSQQTAEGMHDLVLEDMPLSQRLQQRRKRQNPTPTSLTPTDSDPLVRPQPTADADHEAFSQQQAPNQQQQAPSQRQQVPGLQQQQQPDVESEGDELDDLPLAKRPRFSPDPGRPWAGLAKAPSSTRPADRAAAMPQPQPAAAGHGQQAVSKQAAADHGQQAVSKQATAGHSSQRPSVMGSEAGSVGTVTVEETQPASRRTSTDTHTAPQPRVPAGGAACQQGGHAAVQPTAQARQAPAEAARQPGGDWGGVGGPGEEGDVCEGTTHGVRARLFKPRVPRPRPVADVSEAATDGDGDECNPTAWAHTMGCSGQPAAASRTQNASEQPEKDVPMMSADSQPGVQPPGTVKEERPGFPSRGPVKQESGGSLAGGGQGLSDDVSQAPSMSAQPAAACEMPDVVILQPAARHGEQEEVAGWAGGHTAVSEAQEEEGAKGVSQPVSLDVDLRVAARLAEHQAREEAAREAFARRESLRGPLRASIQAKYGDMIKSNNLLGFLRAIQIKVEDFTPNRASIIRIAATDATIAKRKALRAAKIKYHPDKVERALVEAANQLQHLQERLQELQQLNDVQFLVREALLGAPWTLDLGLALPTLDAETAAADACRMAPGSSGQYEAAGVGLGASRANSTTAAESAGGYSVGASGGAHVGGRGSAGPSRANSTAATSSGVPITPTTTIRDIAMAALRSARRGGSPSGSAGPGEGWPGGSGFTETQSLVNSLLGKGNVRGGAKRSVSDAAGGVGQAGGGVTGGGNLGSKGAAEGGAGASGVVASRGAGGGSAINRLQFLDLEGELASGVTDAQRKAAKKALKAARAEVKQALKAAEAAEQSALETVVAYEELSKVVNAFPMP